MSWLDELKVGDRVLYESRLTKSIMTVTNLTKTQIVCGNNRFNRKNGNPIPFDIWSTAAIHELTDERIKKLNVDKYRSHIARCINNIEDEFIVAMYRAWKGF